VQVLKSQRLNEVIGPSVLGRLADGGPPLAEGGPEGLREPGENPPSLSAPLLPRLSSEYWLRDDENDVGPREPVMPPPPLLLLP